MCPQVSAGSAHSSFIIHSTNADPNAQPGVGRGLGNGEQNKHSLPLRSPQRVCEREVLELVVKECSMCHTAEVGLGDS